MNRRIPGPDSGAPDPRSAPPRDDTRRELRALARLGAPIMLAQMFQMGMGVVDSIMAGRYAPVDLAGVALASAIVGPVMVLIMGVLNAVTPIVAQLFGAGRIGEVGGVTRQGLWLALLVGAIGMLAVSQAGFAYGLLDIEAETERVARGYMAAVIWGYPGVGLYMVLRGTCEGLGRTRPAMVVSGVLLGVNALLNYAFIYGRFGAPELGGVGCGVATAIVFWLQFFGMLAIVMLPSYRSARIFRGAWRPRLDQFWRFARIGVPIGVTVFFEIGVYSLVTWLLVPFGSNAVAAHAIAMNINGVTFMIPMSLGMAASIRVGQGVGAGDYAQARLSGRTAVLASLIFAAIVAVALFFLRFPLVALYTNSEEVLNLAANVLLFVAAYQFVDDTQVSAIGALRGYKDTARPMLLALLGYWLVGLPVAVLFGYGWGPIEPLGIYGFWLGLTAGLAFVAVTVNVRRTRLAVDVERIERLARENTEDVT